MSDFLTGTDSQTSLQNLCFQSIEQEIRGRNDLNVSPSDVHPTDTASTSEIQRLTIGNLISAVESAISGEANGSITWKAASSFINSLRKYPQSATFTDNHLGLWVATMLQQDYSRTTIERYLTKISALYTQIAGASAPSEAFATVRTQLKSLPAAKYAVAHETLSRIQQLARDHSQSSSHPAIPLKALIYLFYNPASQPIDLINLRFDTLPILPQQAEEIIDDLRDPKRKYVFPLNQGKKRDGQIARELDSAMSMILSRAGIAHTSSPVDTIRSLWATIALQTAVLPDEIAAILPSTPSSAPYLSMVRPAPLADYEKEEIIFRVADAINPVRSRWHVMKLRTAIRPNHIKDRIATILPDIAKHIIYYYPTHLQVRTVGKKKLTEEVPYLPDHLFFKLRDDRMTRLFSHIGDLAWCYRVSNHPDSPYSVIPQYEMGAFQQFLGILSSDIEVELINPKTLTVGTEVSVQGGIFAGHRGTIRDIIQPSSPTASRTYILTISENTALKCTIKITDTLVKAI